MKRITVFRYAGAFAGDKDAAAKIRDELLEPELRSSKRARVTLDFNGVDLATQSFVHALLSNIVRSSAEDLERISFKNCNQNIRELVEIVAEYSQEELEEEDE